MAGHTDPSREERTDRLPTEKFLGKIFRKPLDKPPKVWYTKYVKRKDTSQTRKD